MVLRVFFFCLLAPVIGLAPRGQNRQYLRVDSNGESNGPQRTLTFFTPVPRQGWKKCGAGCKHWKVLPKKHRSNLLTYCAVDREPNHYKHHYQLFVHAVLSSPHLHSRLGWSLKPTRDPYEADMVLCRAGQAHKYLADAQRPQRQRILAIEDSDSNCLTSETTALLQKEVVATLKHHSWSTSWSCGKYGSQQKLLLEFNYSNHSLDDALFQQQILDADATRSEISNSLESSFSTSLFNTIMAKGSCQQVPASAWKKVHSIIPSHVTVRQGSDVESSEVMGRPIDVAFLGGLHENAEPVAAHRRALLRVLQDLGNKHSWKIEAKQRIAPDDFKKVLAQTKLFVSPWGLGEWSGKDEEAILAGAVPVKPLAQQFQHIAPMYQPGVTCFDVSPDWSNLEQVLARALNDTSKLQEMQRAGRAALTPFFGYSTAAANEDVLESFKNILQEAFPLPKSPVSG